MVWRLRGAYDSMEESLRLGFLAGDFEGGTKRVCWSDP